MVVGLDDIDLTDLDRFVDGFPDDVFTALRRRGARVVARAHRPHTRRRRLLGGERHARDAGGRGRRRAFSSDRPPGAAGGGRSSRTCPSASPPGSCST